MKCRCSKCKTIVNVDDSTFVFMKNTHMKIGLKCWYCNIIFWVDEKDLINTLNMMNI